MSPPQDAEKPWVKTLSAKLTAFPPSHMAPNHRWSAVRPWTYR